MDKISKKVSDAKIKEQGELASAKMAASFNPEEHGFKNTYESRWDKPISKNGYGLCYYAEEKLFYVYHIHEDGNIFETNDFVLALATFMDLG